PPGGFQQPVGYPSAPHYAPPTGRGPIDKPGTITGAAVLAFIQAGITLITTGSMFTAVVSAQNAARALGLKTGGGVAEVWLVSFAQLAGLILLIFGAVTLLSGTGRGLMVLACGLELGIC